MSVINMVCDACHNPTNKLWWFRGFHICQRCKIVIEGKLPERITIPEGCEMRLLFYWWLRLTGRISEAA